MGKIITVGSHEIELFDEQKELFPKEHITKQDIITYYQTIAPFFLQHAKDRPIQMEHFPAGIDHQAIVASHAHDTLPSWIKTKNVHINNTITPYITINTPETLIYLANEYGITPYVWTSTAEHIHQPNWMSFALIGHGNTKLKLLRWAAKRVHELLQKKSMNAYIMTNGKDGLCILVPLMPLYSFETVFQYAQNIATELTTEYSSSFTLSDDAHSNKIWIDISSNQFGNALIAPYAVRGLNHAPIATPIEWNELEHIHPRKFTVKNIVERLRKTGDLWSTMEAQEFE